MNMCIEVGNGLWAFVVLLTGLAALLVAGIGVVGVAERRGARKERLRKVQCGCAVRVGARRVAVASVPAANDPTLRS